jgi:hypothetical protein
MPAETSAELHATSALSCGKTVGANYCSLKQSVSWVYMNVLRGGGVQTASVVGGAVWESLLGGFVRWLC